MSLDAMKQASALICSARLCEVNSMSSRREMLRLMIEATDILRAAIEQAQEPVAWMYVNTDGECEQIEYETPPDDPSITPLYTAPRKWQGLTDEEIENMMDYWSEPARSAYGGAHTANGEYVCIADIIRDAEAKLKEKNT